MLPLCLYAGYMDVRRRAGVGAGRRSGVDTQGKRCLAGGCTRRHIIAYGQGDNTVAATGATYTARRRRVPMCHGGRHDLDRVQSQASANARGHMGRYGTQA